MYIDRTTVVSSTYGDTNSLDAGDTGSLVGIGGSTNRKSEDAHPLLDFGPPDTPPPPFHSLSKPSSSTVSKAESPQETNDGGSENTKEEAITSEVEIPSEYECCYCTAKVPSRIHLRAKYAQSNPQPSAYKSAELCNGSKPIQPSSDDESGEYVDVDENPSTEPGEDEKEEEKEEKKEEEEEEEEEDGDKKEEEQKNEEEKEEEEEGGGEGGGGEGGGGGGGRNTRRRKRKRQDLFITSYFLDGWA
ncbi:hypothetical protein M8J77_008655 [Diaphorina citri]|nr:hypothetical protein M8J77_008655 [Diaphorina citri]